MAGGIWWYEKRGQWCADVPGGARRKRLYLGANKAQAQAALHRYMAEYYERLGSAGDDSRTSVGQVRNGLLLLELAVRFL